MISIWRKVAFGGVREAKGNMGRGGVGVFGRRKGVRRGSEQRRVGRRQDSAEKSHEAWVQRHGPARASAFMQDELYKPHPIDLTFTSSLRHGTI